ncbi:MAG: urease accessory protein UreF [Clostridiales bacterium]|jgi:urease accessory protein|nr:urease accessory protein UreF [Clostridiales bacterium]
MDAQKLFLLLQVNDAAFPIGSYAHSLGLETYIRQGAVSDAASAGAYICQNLRASFLYSELLAAALAFDAAEAGNLGKALELEDTLFASKSPSELRGAAAKLGSRFAKAASVLTRAGDGAGATASGATPEPAFGTIPAPAPAADDGVAAGESAPPFSASDAALAPNAGAHGSAIFGEYVARAGKRVSHAVAYGVFCASLGIDRQSAMAAYLYAQAAAMATNCVKTIPLSQTDGQAILAGLRPLFGELLGALAALGEDDLCRGAPGLDIASMQHERLYSRLYIS